MQETNALPPGQLFAIDDFACRNAAQSIRRYRPSVEILPWGGYPKDVQLLFKMAFISICHQINWDYLQERLAKHLLDKSKSQIIALLSEISARDLNSWFSDYPIPERIRASERAEYLRGVANTLNQNFNGDPWGIIQKSKSKLSGSTGFVAGMDIFEPYRLDPIRKKTHVLSHDLIREKIVEFKDEENVKPAIDYHLIRIYLRTGRVYPIHQSTFDLLKESQPNPRGRLVIELRKAVSLALEKVAYQSGLTIAAVNYIEWQLGRQICVRSQPKCISEEPILGLDPDIAILFKGRCPYVEYCYGYAHQDWMALQEPAFNKSFY